MNRTFGFFRTAFNTYIFNCYTHIPISVPKHRIYFGYYLNFLFKKPDNRLWPPDKIYIFCNQVTNIYLQKNYQIDPRLIAKVLLFQNFWTEYSVEKLPIWQHLQKSTVMDALNIFWKSIIRSSHVRCKYPSKIMYKKLQLRIPTSPS